MSRRSTRERARRGLDLSAFRPEPGTTTAHRASPRQLVALLAVIVLVGAGVAAVSYLVQPNRSRSFDLFYGSLFLNDSTAPVAVDLSNGKPTVRLVDAGNQVSVKSSTDLMVVPLDSGTLLLNQATGEFNIVAPTGFVIKSKGGGVKLPRSNTTSALAAGPDAFLVQGASVLLVNQATVQSAVGATDAIKPRAALSMDEAVAYDRGHPVAASAGAGSIWLLTDSGGRRTVRHLQVPNGSASGATLRRTDHGTVPTVSAVAATVGGDAFGGTGDSSGQTPVIGVAGGGQVRLFRGDDTLRTVSAPGLAGADQIVPGTGGQDALSFLAHSSAGWTLVTVPTGSGSATAHRLGAIPSGAQLVDPAASGGHLYTGDTATGRLYRISTGGAVDSVPGYPSYPVSAIERSGFGDLYLITRGSRVLIDSAGHSKALAVFTDGSQAPRVINKSVAADLSSAGSALALGTKNTTKKPTSKNPKQPANRPKAPQQQQVNQQALCKTVKQTPHTPVILQPTTASRSATLRWSYPLLDPKDCVPSTYTVKITTLSSSAPSAPGTLTVQGQDGVTVAGLFPSTRYQVVVTAFLNGAGTPSAPVQITTGPEGPAAPTNVKASADDNGHWSVSWSSCGGQKDCVPATSWTVAPSFCDGQGLSSLPAPVTQGGDPSQNSFGPVGVNGPQDRGLKFVVTGTGEQGTAGAAASTGCVYSWTKPNPGAFTVHASVPNTTNPGGYATATVSVDITGDPTIAGGGAGATMAAQLLPDNSPNPIQTSPFIPVTSNQNLPLNSIRPGQSYQVRLKIVPSPKSGNDPVFTPAQNLNSVHSSWPKWTVNASWAGGSSLSGPVSVSINGITSDSSGGDSFDISAFVTCGNTSTLPYTKTNADPNDDFQIPQVNRLRLNGSDCHVTVKLTDRGNYYGGADDPQTSPNFTIPTPTLGSTNGFSATWDGTRSGGKYGQIKVSYDGSNPILLDNATNWSMKVNAPSGGFCGNSSGDAPTTEIDNVPSATCFVDANKPPATWTVTIKFTWLLQDQTVTVNVDGTYPGPA